MKIHIIIAMLLLFFEAFGATKLDVILSELDRDPTDERPVDSLVKLLVTPQSPPLTTSDYQQVIAFIKSHPGMKVYTEQPLRLLFPASEITGSVVSWFEGPDANLLTEISIRLVAKLDGRNDRAIEFIRANMDYQTLFGRLTIPEIFDDPYTTLHVKLALLRKYGVEGIFTDPLFPSLLGRDVNLNEKWLNQLWELADREEARKDREPGLLTTVLRFHRFLLKNRLIWQSRPKGEIKAIESTVSNYLRHPKSEADLADSVEALLTLRTQSTEVFGHWVLTFQNLNLTDLMRRTLGSANPSAKWAGYQLVVHYLSMPQQRMLDPLVFVLFMDLLRSNDIEPSKKEKIREYVYYNLKMKRDQIPALAREASITLSPSEMRNLIASDRTRDPHTYASLITQALYFSTSVESTKIALDFITTGVDLASKTPEVTDLINAYQVPLDDPWLRAWPARVCSLVSKKLK